MIARFITTTVAIVIMLVVCGFLIDIITHL
jgi:hypothetical protein